MFIKILVVDDSASDRLIIKDHNCDMVQGYLISKPLDEDDAIMLLKKGKRYC